MADRIASWGYVVLAPNVFHRDGRAADLAPTGRPDGAGEPREVLRRRRDGPGRRASRPTRPSPTPGCGSTRCSSTRGAPDRGHRLLHGRPPRHPHRRPAPRRRRRGRAASTAAAWSTDDPDSPHRAIAGRARGVRLRARRRRPLDAARGGRGARRRRWRRPGSRHTNEVYAGRPARLHDGRHRAVRRGRDRAALRGAAGPVRAHALNGRRDRPPGHVPPARGVRRLHGPGTASSRGRPRPGPANVGSRADLGRPLQTHAAAAVVARGVRIVATCWRTVRCVAEGARDEPGRRGLRRDGAVAPRRADARRDRGPGPGVRHEGGRLRLCRA